MLLKTSKSFSVKNADKDLAYRYAYSNFKTGNYDEAVTFLNK
jgi:hypothetical protein